MKDPIVILGTLDKAKATAAFMRLHLVGGLTVELEAMELGMYEVTVDFVHRNYAIGILRMAGL